MRIAVVNLTGGGFSGGYRKYLRQLMPRLAVDRRVGALRIYVPARSDVLVGGVGAELRAWPADDPRRRYPWLRLELHAFQPDVVFVPTARWFDAGSVPVVTMVRNMEPLLVPFGGNAWTEGLRNVARSWAARRACRRARRVIAVSEFVRDVLCTRWKIDTRTVGVVSHGVDHSTPGPLPPQLSAASPFLFTAGSIRPARGVEDAIAALASINEQARPKRWRLVIAGQPDRGCEGYVRALQRLVRARGVESDVIWAGQLDEQEMAAAYACCAAFVVTSRAEACPNTVLEAMAAGALSVSVDQPPMPEFFGAAAMYYPVADVPALATQLKCVLELDPAAADRLRAEARDRAARFTWDATADRTIRELEIALS